MSQFKCTLQSVGALDIVVEYSTINIICYTDYSEPSGQWSITVTDGDCFWRIGLSERDIAQKSSTIESLRDNILNGDIKFVLKSNGKGVLTIAGLELIVIELSAIERKIEIKSFLFTIVKRLSELKKQVSGYKQEVEDIKRKKVISCDSLSESSIKSGKTNRLKKPSSSGHSIINPSTKRRKAAAGVVFGDDEETK